MTWSRAAAAAVAAALAAAALVPAARQWRRQRHAALNLRDLALLREAVEAFRSRSGRPPRHLDELGPLPPLRGLSRRHPGAEPSSVLELDTAGLVLQVTFGLAGAPSQEAFLVGSWDGRALQRQALTCDRAGCWAVRDLAPGSYVYGVLSADPTAPSVPVKRRSIRLRRPHGEGVMDAFPVEGSLPDAGQWAYDPRSGEVFIACTCRGPAPGGSSWFKF